MIKQKRKWLLYLIVMVAIVIILLLITYKNWGDKKENIEEILSDNIWVGTLQLAWDKIKEEVGHDIELEGVSLEQEERISSLNKSNFNEEDMLSKDNYIIDLKANGKKYLIESRLEKHLSFLVPFDILGEDRFGKEENKIQYFGINASSSQKLYSIVEILFYNSSEDFAISLNTNEGDKIILYKTSDSQKNLEDLWQEIINKSDNYKGKKEFTKIDTLKVPCINLDKKFRYKDLEGKIKDSNKSRIQEILQDVQISLNNEGGRRLNEIELAAQYPSLDSKNFVFDSPFVLFLKENTLPYFACKINDTSFLVKAE